MVSRAVIVLSPGRARGKMDRDDPAYRGQAGYNPFLLAIYDPFVLGFMARAVWRCPTPPVVARYRQHLGRRHLDVGPGTGYFIEQAAPPVGSEVTLLDPNPNVLARSSHRLAAMHPTTIEADAMKPLPGGGSGRSYRISWKLGSLSITAERHTRQARAVLWAFNRRGDFDNLGDTADGLRQILEESFQISAVFRGTYSSLRPDVLRGRVSSIHILVATGGSRLGALSGACSPRGRGARGARPRQ
jgi:SAM-dependent methyltransferase